MSENRSGYAGKIQNAGAQKVSAVYSSGGKKGKSSVTKGRDLRTGKGSK